MNTYLAEYTNDNGAENNSSTLYFVGNLHADAQAQADTVKKFDILVLGELAGRN